ncbi:VirK family protein [Ochrobactrum quorumnocens]|uniref:VirK family protein n=1 Tax=Ochrobactrum quorumnocens TaxID=271865 RepID=UPI0038550C00
MHWNTKLAIVLTATVLSGAAHAETNSQYEAFGSHLLAGGRASALLKLDAFQQVSGDKIKGKATTGGIIVQSFMKLSNSNPSIVFSAAHMTVREDGTPVLEFIRYRLMSDDSATVTVQTHFPRTYDVITEKKVFDCKLADGLTFAYGTTH